jgi:hypothetical protein
MYDLRRIKISKWTGVVLAVVFLSQAIARWREFVSFPTALSYVGITLAITLFLALMTGLAVVVYAEEKAEGNVRHPMAFFERWSDRFFLKH